MRFSTQAIAIAAVAVNAFLCNSAYSQVDGELRASGGGKSYGFFSSPGGEASCGSLSLRLNLVLALKEQVFPGMTYAVKGRPNGAHFAYYCIVLHKDFDEVTGEFPYDCSVKDGRGKIEQSLKIGTLKCKIAYSVVADSKSTSKDQETLTLQGTVVDLSHGRLFILDMTGDAIVIKQAANPCIDAFTIEVGKRRETASRVLSDVSQSLNDGKLETRVVKMNWSGVKTRSRRVTQPRCPEPRLCGRRPARSLRMWA